MRGKDKHDAKNISPPYEFSSIGGDNVCRNKSLLLLFHYSLRFVYGVQYGNGAGSSPPVKI